MVSGELIYKKEENGMQVVEIVRGEEFKIAVKDKITENDMFIKEYRRAAVMLDEITGASLRMNAI